MTTEAGPTPKQDLIDITKDTNPGHSEPDVAETLRAFVRWNSAQGGANTDEVVKLRAEMNAAKSYMSQRISQLEAMVRTQAETILTQGKTISQCQGEIAPIEMLFSNSTTNRCRKSSQCLWNVVDAVTMSSQ